jgi:hypothetical protein
MPVGDAHMQQLATSSKLQQLALALDEGVSSSCLDSLPSSITQLRLQHTHDLFDPHQHWRQACSK